jgi:hypothetical protein
VRAHRLLRYHWQDLVERKPGDLKCRSHLVLIVVYPRVTSLAAHMVDQFGLVAERVVVFYPTAIQLRPVNIERSYPKQPSACKTFCYHAATRTAPSTNDLTINLLSNTLFSALLGLVDSAQSARGEFLNRRSVSLGTMFNFTFQVVTLKT